MHLVPVFWGAEGSSSSSFHGHAEFMQFPECHTRPLAGAARHEVWSPATVRAWLGAEGLPLSRSAGPWWNSNLSHLFSLMRNY